MKSFRSAALSLSACLFFASALAADKVFSGPQPGEKTTPFKVLEVTGAGSGKERDPITDNAGAPTALIFIHAVERSIVPLLKVIDRYGFEHTNILKSEVIYLFADRLAGEERSRTVSKALDLKSRASMSLDGAEGPGNYGLNKECMMTIVVAKENKVTANFALVQPGIADAPQIIAALATVCGDTNPPTAEQLSQRAMAAGAGGRERPGTQREGAPRMTPERAKALADAAAAGAPGNPNDAPGANKSPFPGAVPTDPRLNTWLRQFIRPTNDNATVDMLLADMEKYVKDSPELTKQAVNGYLRVLHFGDRYGTAYAREVGEKSLEKLKATLPAPNPVEKK